MFDRRTLEKLGCWHGYRVERVMWPEKVAGTIELHLRLVSRVMHSQRCGARCREIHETVTRRVRDLPLFDRRVVLVVPRWHVWCEQCGGPQLARLDWLSRYQRVTDRLAEACSPLLRAASVQAVAQFHDLGWHTVKALDKAR